MTSENSVEPEDVETEDAESFQVVLDRALIQWREVLDRLANT